LIGKSAGAIRGREEEGSLEIHHESARKLPSHCLGKVFTGYGATFREARADSEGKCQAAGCHTPGGEPYACDCGHSISYMMPN
jgi:hypothetical protein